MKTNIIVDTGPLVAFFNKRDKYHDWAVMQWAEIKPPMLTCEAVLSEACFLLGPDQGAIITLLERKVLHLPFRLADHIKHIERLLRKYSDVPMSLADACLVRMAELYDDSPLFSIDTDFTVYRKHKKQVIPTILPTLT